MPYLKVWLARNAMAISVHGPFADRCGNAVVDWWSSSTTALNHRALMQEKPVFGISLLRKTPSYPS